MSLSENIEESLLRGQLAAAKAEIERLENENYTLRDSLRYFTGQNDIWPFAVGTASEDRVLRVLYKRAPQGATKEQIYLALYADRHDCDLPDRDKIVDVFVCKLRKKLPQGSIETLWGRGYRLTDIGREFVRGKIEEALGPEYAVFKAA